MVGARLSVVVPSWNGRGLLERLLAALDRQDYRDFDLWLVDNGSSDGTAEAVSGRPGLTLVRLDRNLGFAAAVNRGVAASRGELVLLLNNDMEPEPGFLAALVTAADREPEAGSFACRVLRAGREGTLESAGDGLERSGRSRGLGRDQPDGPRWRERRWVFAGTGGAVLYRRLVLDDVGPLDEDFFLYVEDTDLGFRAQARGWRCRYVPEAVARHVGGASLAGREDLRARYCLRNHLLFLGKNWPWRWLWRDRAEVARGLGRELAFAFAASRARHGAAAAAVLVAAALASAAARLPRMLWRRARFRRAVPLARLEELLG